MSADVVSIDNGERVKVDTDDGYLKVANELLDALCAIDLNGRQFRLVNAVMRLTYGWKGRAMMPFNRDELAGLTGLEVDEVSRIKNALLKAKIIIQDAKEIGLNPYISDWENPKKRTNKTVHSHSKTVQMPSFTKDENCANAQEKLCTLTAETVHSDSKTALPSLLVKDNIKDNIKDMSKPAAQDSEPSPKNIVRPDAAVQSKNGKQWGTQADLDSAKFIFESVATRTMSTKEPNWSDWANTLRLMREQDNREPKHIATLFSFADKHEFWSTVILSPAALRRNWGKVAAQYHEAKHKRGPQTQRAYAQSTSVEEQLSDTSWAGNQKESQRDYVARTTIEERINDISWAKDL